MKEICFIYTKSSGLVFNVKAKTKSKDLTISDLSAMPNAVYHRNIVIYLCIIYAYCPK